MALDVITWILLIAGIIMLLLGIIKVVKASQAVAIIGLVLLVFGGLGALSIIDYGIMTKPTQGFTAGQFQPQAPAAPTASECSVNAITSNGKSQADVLIRNAENASLSYLSGTVAANSGGAFIDSATANAGSSASYVSMSSIPNCGSGELVALVTTGTGLASSKRVRDVEKNQLVSGYNFADKAVHKYEILSAGSDVINILARSSTLTESSSGVANGSIGDEAPADNVVSGTGTADGTAYFKNTTLSAKGSINFYLDIQVNGTSTVAGQYDEIDGVVISYDTGTAARFSPSSLTSAVDQPAGFSLSKASTGSGGCGVDDINTNRNVEACWTVPTMKSGVLYRIRGTLTADLGDPLLSDTMPRIYIDDKVSFRDTDGNVKYKSFSTSGTNQGVGGTELRFVLN